MLAVRIFAYLGQNRNKAHIFLTCCGNGGYFGVFPTGAVVLGLNYFDTADKVDRTSWDCTETIRGDSEMPAKRFNFIAVVLIMAAATGAFAAYTLGLGGRFEVSHSTFLRAGYERGWLDTSSFDGSNMIRIDIGFMF
jgi:hypothetical protein